MPCAKVYSTSPSEHLDLPAPLPGVQVKVLHQSRGVPPPGHVDSVLFKVEGTTSIGSKMIICIEKNYFTTTINYKNILDNVPLQNATEKQKK